MTPLTKITAFAAAVVVAGLLGAGLGAAVGPIGTEPTPHDDTEIVPTPETPPDGGATTTAPAAHGFDHGEGGR